jgi:hypothetical protein
MPGRVFQDDPSILAAEVLFRRIPRSWVNWDEAGNPSISSAAFKDEELSIYIESVMTAEHRPPTDAIRNYFGYGLASITAAQARDQNQAVARDPEESEPAHGVVYGPKKRGGGAAALRDAAIWVIMPVQP